MTVTQSWMENIPIKMQSTLLLGLRGPDNMRIPNVKKICRWLRSLTFKPGDPTNFHEFMELGLPERIKEKSDMARELEYCPMHYYSHLMHALEVVGYCYPDHQIREHAFLLFSDMCNLLHLNPENKIMFFERLGPMAWPGGEQPDTAVQAAKMLLPGGGHA